MARDPVLPSLRAAVFTVVCLGLGAGAHRMMSDSALPASALLFAAVAIYLPVRVATRRERSLAGICALMAALQFGLHLLFDYVQRAPARPGFWQESAAGGGSGATGGMAGMAMPATSTGSGAAHSAAGHAAGGCLLPPAHTAVIGTSNAGMLLAHVLAGVLCACWLYQGEAAVHALARSATAWVLHLVVLPRLHLVLVGIAGRRDPRVDAVLPTPRAAWLRISRPLRGPPRLLSFG
jgi:hypothetical protein